MSIRKAAYPQTVYEMCVTHFFHFLALRVNPETKVHQSIGDGLLRAPVYHAVKFYHPASTHAEDIRHKSCG